MRAFVLLIASDTNSNKVKEVERGESYVDKTLFFLFIFQFLFVFLTKANVLFYILELPRNATLHCDFDYGNLCGWKAAGANDWSFDQTVSDDPSRPLTDHTQGNCKRFSRSSVAFIMLEEVVI